MVDHTKPFSPTDHMGPQPIIEEKVWEDVIPPAMVCSCRILPLFDDPMEGILGDLLPLNLADVNTNWSLHWY